MIARHGGDGVQRRHLAQAEGTERPRKGPLRRGAAQSLDHSDNRLRGDSHNCTVQMYGRQVELELAVMKGSAAELLRQVATLASNGKINGMFRLDDEKKGAVETLILYMAKEFAGRGLTANTIAPGAIETGFLGGAVRDTPAYNEAFAAMTALGRVGDPDDIGPAIASLLGPDNRWITAQHIEVSGAEIFDDANT